MAAICAFVGVYQIVARNNARKVVIRRVEALKGEAVHDYMVGPSPDFEVDYDAMKVNLFGEDSTPLGMIEVDDARLPLEDLKLICELREVRSLECDVRGLSFAEVSEAIGVGHRLERLLVRVDWSEEEQEQLVHQLPKVNVIIRH